MNNKCKLMPPTYTCYGPTGPTHTLNSESKN